MSEISISIEAALGISLSVSDLGPSVSVALVGGQGPQGEVEGETISVLTELLAPVDDDLLVIVDDSESETKSIKLSTLKIYFNS